MRYTVSLKRNNDFKRLYRRGRTAADANLAVYCWKNRLGVNRLGITVSSKHGNAVRRNRMRRRIKEAYRVNEQHFLTGYDIVLVARIRAAHVSFPALEASTRALLRSLRIERTAAPESADGKAGQ